MPDRPRAPQDGAPVWRPAAPGDGPLLRRLFAASRSPLLAALAQCGHVPGSLLEQQFAAQESGYRADWPDVQFLVIEQDGSAVGRLTLAVDGATLHLIDLAVLPEWQGRGIATRVLRQLQSDTAPGGGIRLSVAHGNPAARLYARLGFVQESADRMNGQLAWRRPLDAVPAACGDRVRGIPEDAGLSKGVFHVAT